MSGNSSKENVSVAAMTETDRNRFIQAIGTALTRWNPTLPAGMHLQIAGVTDIPALRRLNVQAIREWGHNELFMSMSEDFLKQMIRDGIILLLEHDKKVLGYSIAILAGCSNPRFLPGETHGKTGLLFGTAVDPSLRGQGWQRKLIRFRLDAFRDVGIFDVQSTVSPFNTPSLRNLLNLGFHVSALNVLLDGHQRFILRYDFGRTVVTSTKRNLILPDFGDLSEHAALLADGFIAIGIKTGNPVTLLYATKRHPVSGSLSV